MATALLLKNPSESYSYDVLEVSHVKGGFIFHSYNPKDDLTVRVICIKVEEAKELVAYLNYQIEKNYGK